MDRPDRNILWRLVLLTFGLFAAAWGAGIAATVTNINGHNPTLEAFLWWLFLPLLIGFIVSLVVSCVWFSEH